MTRRQDIESISIVSPNCFETDTDREEAWYNIGRMDGLAAADEEPNLESLWHDAGEEPRCDELLLGEHPQIKRRQIVYAILMLSETG